MTNDSKLDTVLQFHRLVENRDFARAAQLAHPSLNAVVSGNRLSFAEWRGMGEMFMAAFPDGKHVWDLATAAGDYVILNGHFTGTHRGEFMGIAATGKPVTFSVTVIDRVADGKLVEHRADMDSATLARQLV